MAAASLILHSRQTSKYVSMCYMQHTIKKCRRYVLHKPTYPYICTPDTFAALVHAEHRLQSLTHGLLAGHDLLLPGVRYFARTTSVCACPASNHIPWEHVLVHLPQEHAVQISFRNHTWPCPLHAKSRHTLGRGT